MTSKAIRLKQLASIILKRGHIPKTSELAQRLKVTERTVERYLKELSDLIPDTAIQEIRTKLMLRLRDRIPKMKDHNLIKLAEFFLAKKTAIAAVVAGQIDQKVEVKVPDLSGLDEEAVAAIVKNFLEDEARRLRQQEREIGLSTETEEAEKS